MPYYYDHCARIVYMMFFSWGGEPLRTEIGRILLGMQQSHETLQELPELYKDHPDVITEEMIELLNQLNEGDIRGVEGSWGQAPNALLRGNLDGAPLPRGMLCFIKSLPGSSNSNALLFVWHYL